MSKIKMTTPLVEMDGDEMTRILWAWIKEDLLEPYIELNTEYYDLGLKYRDDTDDQVTFDAAKAIKKYGVGVKCATITANEARRVEYDLKHLHRSPNGTLRAALDGTVFRAPIIVKDIEPYIDRWRKPITIARHAYGDIYRSTEMKVEAGAKAELLVTHADGRQETKEIYTFEDDGVIMGIHNKYKSIRSFAQSCFAYALDVKQNLYFAAKDTISKTYDHYFKDIFQETYDKEFKEKFGYLAGSWRGKKPIQRNAIIALANARDKTSVPNILRCLDEDPRPVIRGTAAWALGILGKGNEEVLLFLEEHLEKESDEEVITELEKAIINIKE